MSHCMSSCSDERMLERSWPPAPSHAVHNTTCQSRLQVQGASAAACGVALLLWAALSIVQWRCSRPLLGPLAGAPDVHVVRHPMIVHNPRILTDGGLFKSLSPATCH